MATQVPPSKDPMPASRRPKPPTKDLEAPQDYKEVFGSRSAPSKFADPCEAASRAALDCLERAHYNRNECMDFFKAYRECKKNWIEQRKTDRRNAT
ncbi:hypothetical protein BCR39DRAFT_521321 [Naematelia encephala]|uniref:Cysteine alpha-hairpin motif superfamily n=1 Tax=Naematelia encephala TaxID=71784 RepID=A0A1Y2BE61_9TREE|nr:hypothetical protein BCR39DRAFT_521321 [Naematelia encephala]